MNLLNADVNIALSIKMASTARKNSTRHYRGKSSARGQGLSRQVEYNPLVTIAIPTFNRAAWLKDCINSALSQTYPNFEVIVSDNASTDETQEVLKSFRDRRLRIVKQKENIGLLPNWNACLAQASGEYIVIVSDDDRIKPWLLERTVALARIDPKIPIIIALFDIYISNIALTKSMQTKLGTGIWQGVDILEELLPIMTGISTFMIGTEALRAIGGFPVDFPHAADLAVCVPLLFAGRAGLVNESCGTLYLHEARETSKLAVNLRLNDCEKVSNLINSLADRSIDDPKKRERIKLFSKRFLARIALAHLTQFRREGAKLTDMLPLIWHWRDKLKTAGMRHIFRFIITMIVFVLPVRIVDWSRYARRNYRYKLSGKLSKTLPFAEL